MVGEPGVGKTRLFNEFTRRRSLDAWLRLETDTLSYGRASVYLPVIDLLKGYFELDDADDPRRVREKVSGKLVTLDRSLMTGMPALLSLLDVPVEEPEWQRLDPPQRRERTLDAVKGLLLRESREQPVCLVIENLHWVDSETEALIGRLIDSLPNARLLLLTNYRPEYAHEWGGRSHYTQIRLDPLPVASAEELLTTLLGADPALEPLKALLIERTDGNPFFLEEIVRTLIESGALAGKPGAYRLVTRLPEVEVPVTVQAVLGARLDRLDSTDKRLLEAAAVVGHEVPYRLMGAVADLPEDRLRSGLAALQAGEFLYESSLFPEQVYSFRHALTHQVAYGTLLHEDRRALHARVAACIEETCADNLEEQVERLAYHAFRSEQWDRAVRYLMRAAAKAGSRHAYREAATAYEQALEALTHLPESGETLAQGVDARFGLRTSLQALGDNERVFAYLTEAEALASSLGDRDRLGWASAYLSQYHWRMGDPKRGRTLGERALSIASELEDPALEVVSNFFLGQGSFNVGEFRRAISHCEKSVAALVGESVYERMGLTGLPSVLARMWTAWSLAELGRFDEALAQADAAIDIAETSGQPYSTVAAYLAAGQLQVLRGRLEDALPPLERAEALCEQWNLGVTLPTVASLLGLAYALDGRLDEALSVVESTEASVSSVLIFNTSTAATARARVLLVAGRTDEAAEIAERIDRQATERGLRANRARAALLRGDIAAAQGRHDTAHEHYEIALTLSEELEMPPLAAQCRLALGRLCARSAQRPRAAELLSDAARRFDELGMSSARDEATTALAALGEGT